MADPVSISGTVVGVISLGMTVCSGIIEYYCTWKDREQECDSLQGVLGGLTKTLALIKQKIIGSTFDHETVENVTKAIIDSSGPIRELERRLKKLKDPTSNKFAAGFRNTLYPFRATTLQKLKNNIVELRDSLSLAVQCLQIDASSANLDKLTLIDGKITLIDGKVDAQSDALTNVNRNVLDVLQAQKDQNDHALNMEAMKAISWLSPTLNFRAKQIDVHGTAHRGTGEWFLQCTEFRAWLNGTTKILWCPGIPGAGKTVLASIIIDYLQETKQATVGVAYVYVTYNEPLHTAENLIASLLQQLCQQKASTPETVLGSYKEHVKSKTRPKLSEYSRMLSSVCQTFSNIFVVVDALDECSETHSNRENFMTELLKMSPKTRLLVTSRHFASIKSKIKGDSFVEIRADDDDVESFLQNYISQHRELAALIRDRDDLRNEIIDTVVSKSKGMFLLATLHMDSLAQEDNISDLKAALNRLPETIKKTYEEALERMQNQGSRRAERGNEVLMWITLTQRPLTVSELLVALAVRRGDRDLDQDRTPQKEMLLSACCGLVVIDEESQIIRLVHYTAEEYLAYVRQTRFPNGHQFITEALLTYLRFAIFDARTDGPSQLEVDSKYQLDVDQYCKTLIAENLLLAYATEHWGLHAQEALRLRLLDGKANSRTSTRDPEDMINAFLALSGNVTTYVRIRHHLERRRDLEIDEHAPESVSRLLLAAGAGVCLLVQSYIEKGANVNEEDSNGFTAMHYAAANNHIQIVKLLLNQQIQLHAQNCDNQTALDLAITAGHPAVVRMLVEEWSEATAEDRLDALRTAAWAGNEDISRIVMAQVMAHTESEEVRCGMLDEVLDGACWTGQEELVQFALTYALDSDIAGGRFTRDLANAAFKGNLCIMTTLLDRGVGANSPAWDQDMYPMGYEDTPLVAAVAGKEVRAVQLLLERGADPNVAGSDGDLPVHRAIFHGNDLGVSILRLLFYYNAEVNVLNRQNETPMILLCKSRYEDTSSEPVARILLDKGADIAVTDGEHGRTALEWAVLAGNEPLVGLLLDQSAGQLPKTLLILLTKLYHALYMRKDEEIQNLLQHDLILQVRSMPTLLLLHSPAKSGQKVAVQFLLQMGADVEAKNKKGKTALHLASKQGYLSVTELLLKYGAKIEAKTERGKTALHLASKKGFLSVAELLLEHSANTEAKTQKGETALHRAMSGCPAVGEVVQLLLEHGANTDVLDCDGQNLLTKAIYSDHYPIVEILLVHGVSPNTILTGAYSGLTALYIALHQPDDTMLRLLLHHGADMKLSDVHCGGLLHVAVDAGCRESMIKLLLDNGADLAALDSRGYTPLVTAVQKGMVSIVGTLLERGANPVGVLSALQDQDEVSGPSTRVSEGDFEKVVELVRQAERKLQSHHLSPMAEPAQHQV